MVILINGMPAAIKKGSSFEFISENCLFTGADAYSLSITFPLAGCPQNLAIFGHLNRKDNDLNKLLLDCEIHEGSLNMYGAVNIVSITEKEVKTQFLEGRSVSNFSSDLDKVYINELDLGSTHKLLTGDNKYMGPNVMAYREQIERREYTGYVYLPWVNNTTGNIQNPVVEQGDPYYFSYKYAGGEHDYYPEVCGQPYLLHVIKRVLDEVGFGFDDSNLEGTWWEDVIVCNTLPLAWEMPELKYVLPHWTVAEFMEQVELFMDAQFVLDKPKNCYHLELNATVRSNMKEVVLDKVVDVHQVDLKDKNSVKDTFHDQLNVAYADCDHQQWPFYSCDGIEHKLPIHRWANITNMKATLDNYLDRVGTLKHDYYKQLHYCVSEDTYFVLRCCSIGMIVGQVRHYMHYMPVNVFGPHIINKENSDIKEMSIVPVCIDHVDKGDLFFLECGQLGDDTGAKDPNPDQSFAVNTIKSGSSLKSEYFDKLYVGFWIGNFSFDYPNLPHPIIDKYEVLPNNTVKTWAHTMRLNGNKAYIGRRQKFAVDQSKKFSFTFIADAIPNVQSCFFIHGKKYLAEKITATFSESGMSQKMKMVAYRVEELPH